MASAVCAVGGSFSLAAIPTQLFIMTGSSAAVGASAVVSFTDRPSSGGDQELPGQAPSQIAGALISPKWGAVLDQLRLLDGFFEPDAGLGELRPALKELAELASDQPAAATPEEQPIRLAVTGLSALAFLDMTISDAFKDESFDVAGAPDAAGPYVDLAAARRELGVSAESCRRAVQRIRLTLGLP
ncbi:hypothetical protein ACIBIZ_52175 [Nonomuraea spiralis]|uniref:hypothetical protein n=1 Tax=Nonomuraea spiralis TaxID=46182 RepID=UPI003793E685